MIDGVRVHVMEIKQRAAAESAAQGIQKLGLGHFLIGNLGLRNVIFQKEWDRFPAEDGGKICADHYGKGARAVFARSRQPAMRR